MRDKTNHSFLVKKIPANKQVFFNNYLQLNAVYRQSNSTKVSTSAS